MALKDIVGQGKALDVLRGFIERDRIPHALLFAGDEGIGKRLAAQNFAKAINCLKTEDSDLFSGTGTEGADQQDADEADACDRCVSC